MHAETVKALKSPDIVEVLAQRGQRAGRQHAAEAAEFLKVEIARWGKVIRQAKVKID